uniref:Uncharacterized protein n=1 Tax=Callorhinchus milii TaxID=7868 RepID=A0A4W3GD81_CALMI
PLTVIMNAQRQLCWGMVAGGQNVFFLFDPYLRSRSPRLGDASLCEGRCVNASRYEIREYPAQVWGPGSGRDCPVLCKCNLLLLGWGAVPCSQRESASDKR